MIVRALPFPLVVIAGLTAPTIGHACALDDTIFRVKVQASIGLHRKAQVRYGAGLGVTQWICSTNYRRPSLRSVFPSLGLDGRITAGGKRPVRLDLGGGLGMTMIRRDPVTYKPAMHLTLHPQAGVAWERGRGTGLSRGGEIWGGPLPGLAPAVAYSFTTWSRSRPEQEREHELHLGLDGGPWLEAVLGRVELRRNSPDIRVTDLL